MIGLGSAWFSRRGALGGIGSLALFALQSPATPPIADPTGADPTGAGPARVDPARGGHAGSDPTGVDGVRAAEPTPQEPAPGAAPLGTSPSATPHADAPAPPTLLWDGSAPRDPDELAALLKSFASAYPRSLRVQSLGHSRAGRDIWWVRVTRAKPDVQDHLPAILVAPSSTSPSDAASLARSLRLCLGLVERAKTDPALAERLTSAVVDWLVAPDPDRLFPPRGEAQADGGMEYPAGWTAGLHPYPLFDPGARAIAEFLVRQPGIALLATADPAAREPLSLGDPARPDGAAALGGSLERFVREYLGVRVGSFAGVEAITAAAGSNSSAPRVPGVTDLTGGTTPADTSAPSTEVPPAADVAAAALQRSRASERIDLLLAALPRLAASVVKLERLRPDLWMVDIVIENRGRVGTLEGAAAAREASSVWADVSGAQISAAGLSSFRPLPPADGTGGPTVESGAGAPVFAPLVARKGTLELGHLAGGSTRTLRLVLAGTEGQNAELQLRSLRAGALDLTVELK